MAPLHREVVRNTTCSQVAATLGPSAPIDVSVCLANKYPAARNSTRVRTKEPKFLAQVTNPQVFVIAG
jgi:hypothetical protein